MQLEVYVPVVLDLPIGATRDHVRNPGPLDIEPLVFLYDEDEHALFGTPASLIEQRIELI